MEAGYNPYLRVGKLIRELRTRRGLTQAQLAEAAQVHVITLTNIERGRRLPKPETVSRLLRALGEDPTAALAKLTSQTSPEDMIATDYNKLDAMGYGQGMVPIRAYINNAEWQSGSKVAIGYMHLPRGIYGDFYLYLKDDSLEPYYPAHTLVLFEANPSEIKPGDIALVVTPHGECILRKIGVTEKEYVLLPVNPKYRLRVYSMKSVKIVGKIIYPKQYIRVMEVDSCTGEDSEKCKEEQQSS